MSKRSAKRHVDPNLVTRKQQVRAVRDMKTQEVAEAVAGRIQEAVKSEVARQLEVIKDEMLNMIDRVALLETHKEMTFCEADSSDRQEGTEAVEVSEDDTLAPESLIEEPSIDSQDFPDDHA